MNSGFVPFASPTTPTAPASRKLRVKILSPASPSASPPGAPASADAPPPASVAERVESSLVRAGEPQITLLRDGDQVSGIIIRCACGQTTELRCVY